MKRFLSLLLVCAMLTTIAAIPAGAFYDGNGGYVINGITVHADDYPQYSGNCWVYANALYQKVWGTSFSGDFDTPDNMLRNLTDDELYITPEHIRAYVTAAPIGSTLRIAGPANLHGDDLRGHSQFIVDKDDYGFTVFQANMPGITVNYYTWERWANTWLTSSRQYIKYIKYPGAIPYSPPRPSAVTLSATPTTIDMGSSITFSVSGRDYTSSQLIVTDKNGHTTYLVTNPTAVTTLKFSDPGIYSAVFRATNIFGTTDSPHITLTVNCVHKFGKSIPVREPSCKIKGLSVAYCSVCGVQQRTILPAPEHKISEWIIGAQPSCLSQGERHTVCTVCGMVISSEAIPATGHKWREASTDPSCTAPGSVTLTCVTCGETVVDSYSDPLPHDWANSSLCAFCGLEAPVSNDLSDPNDPDHIHDYALDITHPTCRSGGYTTAVCACGHTTIVCVTPALGHNYEQQAIVEPTGTATGHAVYACSRCDAGYEETLAALGTLANHFTDVKAGRYYTGPVMWALRSGITEGVSPTLFGADEACTRGQVITFLWRAFGCPKATIKSVPFTDVRSSAFYYQALLWAYEKGIVDGLTPTAFGPRNLVTRGQFVTILWRAEHKPSGNGSCDFTDVYFDSFCFEAVLWASAAGVTDGVNPTTFAPNKPCTRGQVVTFLSREMQ